MPSLTLTILRFPEYGTAEQRCVKSSSLTVGRGAECDWALPDPFKSLSRKHCQLESVAGVWQVRDLSSNGTFLNSAGSAIGRDGIQPIRDGDRLHLGDYEVGIRVDEDAGFAFDDAAPAVRSPGFEAVRLPGLDDPVPPTSPGLSGPALHTFGAIPDHAPAGAQAFVPPPAATSGRVSAKPIVPDNWYQALEPAVQAAPPPPATAAPVEPAREVPSTRTSAPAVAIPYQALNEPQIPPAVVPPAVIADGAASATTGSTAAAVAILLAGAELSPATASLASADPDATLHNSGAMLRASVAGIRALLIARGSVKRGFRIEQTVLRARENNPLKFAASDEQALAALLDQRTPALPALQEAIEDLIQHQVAVLAATQAAARALLERMDPSSVEAEDKGGGLFSDSLEKRLWEAYKRRHTQLTEQFEDDFESAFGKAFARAYENAVKGARD